MIDWTKSMKQTYEFYEVDPNSWLNKRKLDNFISGTIELDEEKDTLSSATFDVSDAIEECYVRPYLVAIQNGVEYRFPLGTYLCQTPEIGFDGRSKSTILDGYSPLIELKEKYPPFGYFIEKDARIMERAYALVKGNLRAPVVQASSNETIGYNFVSDGNEKWLDYIKSFISNAKFKFGLDDMGRVIFHPYQSLDTMGSKWTYDDGNSSILLSEISISRDLYNLPNVVEIISSTSESRNSFYVKIVNDNPNSPISTVNRGREIVYRESNPSITGTITRERIEEYAQQLLRSVSSLEYRVTYEHGYCPVTIGDCVTLNYKRAGLENVRAKVVSQSMQLKTGCTVSETAVFTSQLFGGIIDGNITQFIG